MIKAFIPRETAAGEPRVAATPETVKKLVKAGLSVLVEAGAGAHSFFADHEYEEAGAAITSDAAAAWGEADLVLRVREPSREEAARLRSGALLVSFIAPHKNPELVADLRDKKVSTLAMELIPRITRAQSMDALSSQASIAGYRAVLLAALHLPKYFPLLMTAAGTVKPAKVVIMGAGVAGLQAVATARRLGAVVEVSDIRDVVQEQVESLGGHFIELPDMGGGEGEGGYARQVTEEFLTKQREIVQRHVAAANVVITTALVPGRPAPMLVPKTMVEAMSAGSVIVDLAIEQGGNCELSEADREVVHNGVKILAPSNLAGEMSRDASTLYARNVLALLEPLIERPEEGDASLRLDLEDEVVAGTLLTHDGEVLHGPTAERLGAGA